VTPSPLLFLATGVRYCYLPTKIRIRQWGVLPNPRGPTVLITNHQHVDEGEIVYSRTFLRHPHIPIVAVNSRRTFETGFFAARLPWTAPFMRHVNPSPLWHALSLLPIENHLHSRALISLAEEARRVHGDIPLETLLAGDVVANLGLTGCTLADLWKPAHFARAQATVKLANLKQPYRREALENFRATMTADIATVVERVRAGATFYVTPEGDFSHDGFLRPLRNGLTDAVLPVAEPWLCAIAYDPFRGRRLSMLYRIVRPARPGDLTTSLAAARAVTTSALLATFLCGVDAPFAAAAAREAVRARLDALPAGAFVDPELRRDPDAVVAEALSVLVRMGFLAADGPRYRLTETRADARFPHAADMLSFQRNMLEETLAAAARLSVDGGE
jgi:hypothetical protein